MSDDSSDRAPSPELSTEDEIRKHLGRNYPAQLVHGMLAMTGFRLVNAPTFMPAYLHTLSGSDFFVGAAMAAQNFGSFVSSISGAVAVEHRPRVLPLGFVLGWAMRLSVLGLALAGFFLVSPWLLPALAFFLLALGIFGGMQNVLFNVLMAKTIPQNQRGKLLGLRFFLGGLIASLVAWIGGRYLVEGNVLGNGYATTFLLAFGLTALGLTTLMFVREPESRELRAQSNTRSRLKEIPALLREEPNFARYFAVQVLATAGFVAVPFYVLGAGQTLGLSGTLLGDLSLVLLMSQTFAHLGWGWMGDRTGFRLVLLGALSLWAIGGVGLAFAASFWTVALAFVALGAGMAGFFLGTQNMVFDFGGQKDLPMRLALVNSSQSLIQGLGALLGGQLAYWAGYDALFIMAALVKACAAVLLWVRVKEPRQSAR